MAVHLSKPPKKITLTRQSDKVRGVRWRSPEERRESKRKIEAIRRAAERERLEHGTRLDLTVLRSPKVTVGILLLLLLVGGALMNAFQRPPQPLAKTEPLAQIRARKSVQVVAQAMTLYRVHTGSWPSQRLGLFALAKDYHVPGWKGPYINWAYKDPWGTPYVYEMPLSPFEPPVFFSCGQDERANTNDDIRAMPEDFVCAEGTWKRPEPSESDTPAPDQPPNPVTGELP